MQISKSYNEVRNLIIDWLAEVSESLKLGIHQSAYNGILILDRFLTNMKINHDKDMD